jgi:hypothetical protein
VENPIAIVVLSDAGVFHVRPAVPVAKAVRLAGLAMLPGAPFPRDGFRFRDRGAGFRALHIHKNELIETY